MTFDFDKPVMRRGTCSYKWDSDHMADNVIPMWVADMDFTTAPCIIEALRSRVDHGVFGYVSMPDEYYDVVTDWFARRHSWHIDREWIQYTSGVVPAISAIIKALTKPRDKVIVLTPVYNCFFSSIRNNGCEAVECPLVYEDETYSIDYDLLNECIADKSAKLLLFCNPHNPAGRVWTINEMKRVGEMCKHNGVVVVSDEIHCELVMGGHEFVPFASISPEFQDLCITCNSPSKAFNTAGLQIANIICNNPVTRAKIDRAINDNEVCDVNPFGVVGLIAAYGHGEQWLDALCSYIEENYNVVREFFSKHLPHLPVTKLEGTYLVWVDCRALNKSSDQVVDEVLQGAKVLLNSGSMYGAAGEGFVRINIACPRAQVIEALNRMLPVLKSR